MRADNSHHLIAAAQQRAEQTRTSALNAIRRLDEAGAPITMDSLAREAGVSRSWLYSQHDIRAQVHALRGRRHAAAPAPLPPQPQRATPASLLRRLEAATARMRQLEENNRQLRQALAVALGTARTDRVTGKTTRHDTPEQQAAKLTGPI